MARIQLTVPDAERDRYAPQAHKEGLTLSAWLRKAAEERLDKQQKTASRSSSVAKLRELWAWSDQLPGPDVEPDWEEHLKAINDAKGSGAAPT